MGRLAKVLQGQSQPGLKVFKKGGKVHDDEAEDRALFRQMMREDKAKKNGVKKMKKGY